MGLHQGPVDAAIKATLTGRKRFLDIMRNINLEAQTSQCCQEAELKREAKI